MAKITGGLFGEDTQGTVGSLITFRTRNGKTETLHHTPINKLPSPAQLKIRGCYSTAHTTWMQLPKQPIIINKHTYHRRTPNWPTYWKIWLQDHPECKTP